MVECDDIVDGECRCSMALASGELCMKIVNDMDYELLNRFLNVPIYGRTFVVDDISSYGWGIDETYVLKDGTIKFINHFEVV